tara:strand:- start:1 stop:225 length:225 start_codon:yes stop_codon:yes gene_type:complete
VQADGYATTCSGLTPKGGPASRVQANGQNDGSNSAIGWLHLMNAGWCFASSKSWMRKTRLEIGTLDKMGQRDEN